MEVRTRSSMTNLGWRGYADMLNSTFSSNVSIQKLGAEHPFLEAQEERVQRLQRTILLDLDGALKRTTADSKHTGTGILDILDIFKTLDKTQTAIKTLREIKK